MIKNMENAFSVKGKNILITGGNRGIGKGISTAMAQSGANVAILARNEESSIATIEELNQYGGDHRYYYGDVTDIKSAKTAVEDIVKDYGTIDALVNNSGIGRFFDTLDQDEDLKDWHDVINVNLNGYFTMCYLVGRVMRDQNYGRMVNISSNASRFVNLPQRMVSYSASKAAIDRMTQCLAHEWAKYNIRVNAIAPGYTETELTFDKNPDYIRYWMSATPVGRFGKPIEIGALAVYLVSEASEQMTGAILTIDGGYMLAGNS
jgi:NAD(P)-dependent dehydrogenase (short-subunit alcohol dehydrogenase family)